MTAWTRLGSALPDGLRADLRPGASDETLTAAETALGAALPPDVRDAFATHDGQRGDAPGVVIGLRLLPLADALDEWRKWQSVDTDGFHVEADPGVHADYVNERWLPLADDGAGNHVALDLAPTPDGTFGQIITFGADEVRRQWLAPSLGDFLDRLAALWAEGRIVLRPDGEIGLADDARDLFQAADDLFG